MSTLRLVTETERELRRLSGDLTDPADRECLLCYIYRMLEFGCTGLRWAQRYRDMRAPRATALEQRLGQRGGYCDCEIFLNAFELAPQHWVPEREYVEDCVTYLSDATYPDQMPGCRGVPPGSTQGCALWVRQYRGRPW